MPQNKTDIIKTAIAKSIAAFIMEDVANRSSIGNELKFIEEGLKNKIIEEWAIEIKKELDSWSFDLQRAMD